MTQGFSRDLPFGARLVSPDRTRFRLFAPAQQHVEVEIEGESTRPMRRFDEGWFEAEAPCGAGAHYLYVLEDGSRVPDPASRRQESDVHDWSVVVDPAAYAWQTPDWRGRPWRETVIYELHCGLFGGFCGVVAALPRLADLGVTAVELMPINDFSGSRNWGYDGVLPFAPDSSYGSPDDLKALVDAAHAHGLMIFLDVVYNHFGPDGNYLARYAPPTFRDDFHTPWGAGIDFRRAEVRRFFTENALYWLLEYRFDGLRLDAVHAISEPRWLDEMAAEVRASVEVGRHVHLILEHEGNVASHLRGDFDAQWNDDLHNATHVLLTGETEGYYHDYADETAAKLARGLAEGFVYQGEPSPHHGGAARGTPSADLSPTSFVFFLQNHDQIGNRAFGERLTVLCPPGALEAAIAFQILTPQIPLLFMGEEDASKTPFFFFSDYAGELADAVREGRRKEFARFKAFSDEGTREKIPDPNALSTFEQSRPRPDPEDGVARFALYRRLLTLRQSLIVPRLAGARAGRASVLGKAAVRAHWRLGDGSNLTLLSNLDAEPVSAAAPPGAVVFESRAGASHAVAGWTLPGQTTIAYLEAQG
jgi:malto-oligosyltrehalose trehalohydrolase